MQRLSPAPAVAFAEVDGAAGGVRPPSPASRSWWTPATWLGFDRRRVRSTSSQVTGLKNKLLGGEGLFNTVLTGPGRIWLQTMPISGVAAALLPYIPTGNN